MLYGARSSGKEHGVVQTKPQVVMKMLDLVDYKSNLDLSQITVLEPSVGEGAFALPIIERLHKSSELFSFDFELSLANLNFYDIDQNSLDVLRQKIKGRFKTISPSVIHKMLHCGDFLSTKVDSCDLVIGNPPYVRHENIPDELKRLYRADFRTFTHRSDLYIPFFEKGLTLLNKAGRLSYICSNRWLKNQYGKQLRQMISSGFEMQEVIDLEKVDAFEESVIAYPAITTIVNSKSSKPAPYYDLENLESLLLFNSESIPDRLLSTNPTNWFSRDYSDNEVSLKLTTIADQGFKIGIGVATGRDKVFIRKDFKELVEEELLLPILTSRGVSGNAIEWKGNFFINPYNSEGRLIDLDKFPRAKKYFEENYDLLAARHVSKKNPINWYRTIDKVHASLTTTPKIILPDITGNKLIHIDEGNFYPHHNLYYITGKDIDTLELLAAILMSDFVRSQLGEMGNKMNGGYPRWQSQNIRKLQVPYLDSIPLDTAASIRSAYKKQNLVAINSLVNLASFSDFERTEGQLTVFEPKSSENYANTGL
jgi:adenine-specific DNA-methyltransferase